MNDFGTVPAARLGRTDLLVGLAGGSAVLLAVRLQPWVGTLGTIALAGALAFTAGKARSWRWLSGRVLNGAIVVAALAFVALVTWTVL